MGGVMRTRIRAGELVAYVLVLPTSGALVVTHKHREPIGDPPDAAYEPIVFESSDGLELAGWYRPSENRAAVLIVHGGGGDRNGTVRHAELLAKDGTYARLYRTQYAVERAAA